MLPPTILAAFLRRKAIPPELQAPCYSPSLAWKTRTAFFALAHQLEEQMGADALESSPWYLLARTILLFKTNKMRPATRALREFANRCEGGAFFLLNPMYQTPYLPCRPEPRDPWDLSHQAVWEADGIISDTPDFAPWANACEDVSQLAQEFARRYGF